MPIKRGYGAISGYSLDDACFIGCRWDPRVELSGDQLVVYAQGGAHESVLWTSNCRDLWRSPRGSVFVAATTSVLWSDNPRAEGAKWHRFDCEYATGIWGLADDCVFAFPKGIAQCTHVYRFDGRSWSRHECPGAFLGMHGADRDLIYGAGMRGLLARWDGTGWRKQPTGAGAVFLGLHVASDDEMYAIDDSGQLWEGSIHGWSIRAEAAPYSLDSIAKWRDRVWVGTATDGLCVLDGTQLRSVAPAIRASQMDVRGNLVASSPESCVESSDGDTFRTVGTTALEPLFATRAPQWIPSVLSK